MVNMPNIKLKSSDGQVFDVDVEIAKDSGAIKTALESVHVPVEQAVIQLCDVKGVMLEKALQWMTHHHYDPPEEHQDFEEFIEDNNAWNAEFFKVDQDTLFDLILAANSLDIKGLHSAACQTVANMIKGKGVDEIRKTFNVKNDFTPDEEKTNRHKNSWCE